MRVSVGPTSSAYCKVLVWKEPSSDGLCSEVVLLRQRRRRIACYMMAPPSKTLCRSHASSAVGFSARRGIRPAETSAIRMTFQIPVRNMAPQPPPYCYLFKP